MTAGALRYVPGTAIAVVHERTAVLLDVAGDDPLVARVATLVEAGGGVDDVLDALVTSGLKSLADFGAFEVKPDGVRLVVRGKVTGSVGELAGLNSEHTMWHDTWQPGAVTAGLALAESASAPRLVIRSGVVLAAGVAFTSEAGSAEVGPTGTRSTETVPTRSAAAAPKVVAGPAVTADGPQRVAAVEAGDELAHLFGATQRPPVPAAEEVESANEPQSAVSPVIDPGATMVAPLTIPTAELPKAAQLVEPVVATLITGMPWATDAPSASVQPPPAPPQPAAAPPAPPAAPQPAAAPPPAAPRAAAPTPASPFGEAPAVEQGWDRTVNRSSLVGLPAVVMVVAARCGAGHLSPAYAGTCRVCGAPIPPQQPVEIPRPTLGQLRLSTGGIVPLDRPLILGRNPRIPPGYAAEQPNLVRLPDPEKDVSGQHLEVTLDYWNVLVRDLGSTNGTEVILPGAMPVALRANDPVIIEPGTRVVLAGTISFTFEVLP